MRVKAQTRFHCVVAVGAGGETTARSTESDSAKHLKCRNVLSAIDLAPEDAKLIRNMAEAGVRTGLAAASVARGDEGCPPAPHSRCEEFQRFLLNTAERETKDFQARLETKMAGSQARRRGGYGSHCGSGSVIGSDRDLALQAARDSRRSSEQRLSHSSGSFLSGGQFSIVSFTIVPIGDQ